jgi:type I restriction enzyme M protein
VDWKKYSDEVNKEAAEKGFDGRYGAGLPRVSDGSFLFLQHMISKMKPVNDDPATPDVIEGGSRIAIILSGSPLFSGQAGSGESDIRRWIIENDWLEGLVAMPDSMFYNTGIGTYIWIINNRKKENAKGLVKLVDARAMGTKMRKSLGDKRKELTNDAIAEITRIYDEALGKKKDERVKVMRNEEFGFARLTIERPLRRIWRLDEAALLSAPAAIRSRLETMKHTTFADQKDAETALVKAGLAGKEITAAIKALATTEPTAKPSVGKKGDVEADADLRDNENISLPKGFIQMDGKKQESAIAKLAQEHLIQEIHPYVPDAWVDHGKTKIGYEIPFTRQFYVYTPPRPVAEIRSEIESLEKQIQDLMKDLM